MTNLAFDWQISEYMIYCRGRQLREKTMNSCEQSLRLNADVVLRDGGGAVLQKALDQSDVIAVVFVNLGGIPLAEAVSDDPMIAQVIANNSKLLLNGPFSDGKHKVIALDLIAQAIVSDILLDNKRNSEDAIFASLSLRNLQAAAISIQNNVTRAEAENVADPQAQVPLRNKSGGDAFIWAAAAKALFYGGNNLFVLLCFQGGSFLVHSIFRK